VLGALTLGAVAMAQGPALPAAPPPLDVNNLRPEKPVAKPTAPPDGVAPDADNAKKADAVKPDGAAATQAEMDRKAADAEARAKGSMSAPGEPSACDGPAYKVSQFVLEWNTPNDEHPPLDELLDAPVTLGVTSKGYVSSYEQSENGDVLKDIRGVAEKRSGTNLVTMKIRDVPGGTGATLYASALEDINQAIVDELHRRGLIAVFVYAAEDQIASEPSEDHAKGDDLRDGKTENLTLVLWTGSIGQVRSVASGPRLEKRIESAELTRVDATDRVHTRIREQSPVKPGSLVRKDMIDDYLFRLNRHQGRRVDVAVAPGEKPEEVTLDYMVSENKPWTAYFQFSNTGTKQTNQWRERFGFVHNQLTNHDDVLRLDYVTGGFEQANAVNLSYEFPIISDRLKFRAYGAYAEYSASDVGFADEVFEGTNSNGGGEMIANVFQHRAWFLDVIGGVKWQSVEVINSILDQEGKDDFWTPYVGVSLERYTDESSTYANTTVSWNADDLNEANKDRLGRTKVDSSFTVLRFAAEHATYLEPLFNSWGWFQGSDGKGLRSLTNEVSASVRGQWGLGNRLIPNEEEVAGGLFSVRGYPESVVAGDDVVIGTLEYRFHLPSAFGLSDPGKWGNSQMPEFFGRDFRWRPQQDFGRADWDLIFKTFVDCANTNASDKEQGELADTLISTGLGVEFVYKRNVSVRLDWGVALKGAGTKDPGSDDREVRPGDNEWHFLMTLSY